MNITACRLANWLLVKSGWALSYQHGYVGNFQEAEATAFSERLA